MENNKKYTIIAIVVLLVIFAALAWWSVSGTKNTLNNTPTSIEDQVGQNAVVVSNARPNNIVALDSVTLAHAGFVAIHEDSVGMPGAIIGVSDYLYAGTRVGVAIKLSRTSRNGEILYAMIHNDDGDQKFDAALDLPAKENGEVVMQRFSVDVNAPEAADRKL
jgi:hypothetical protein